MALKEDLELNQCLFTYLIKLNSISNGSPSMWVKTIENFSFHRETWFYFIYPKPKFFFFFFDNCPKAEVGGFKDLFWTKKKEKKGLRFFISPFVICIKAVIFLKIPYFLDGFIFYGKENKCSVHFE